MDFQLSKEQIDIQSAAREFAKGEFDRDTALEYESSQQVPLGILKKACHLGFVGIHFPEAYGGQGCGILENALVVEAFCRQDSGIGAVLALADFGSEIILKNGLDDQKTKILPLITQGKGIVTSAFLEENFVLFPMNTTAQMENSDYIVSGKKCFVTLGSMATYLIVLCETGHGNIQAQTVILIEKERDGIAVSSMGEKVGMRMISVDQITFTNVNVPKDNTIGQKDMGYSLFQDFLNVFRIEAGAIGVGIAQGALDMALDYAKRRKQFGKPIASFGAIRGKLADMYVDIEMARSVTYKAAWSFDIGKPDIRSILMAKMVASKAAYRTAYEAVQIHGGYGYMRESYVEHFYRDAKVLDLFLEPGQMQKNALADLLLVRPQKA